MRNFLIASLLLFSYLTSSGQTDGAKIFPEKRENKVLSNGSKINVINLMQQHYIYNNSTDTIILSSISPDGLCFCNSPKIISAIQIDGIGAKELIIFRKCNISSISYQQSFPVKTKGKINKYEIWNLDTKELLFEATNYCKTHTRKKVFSTTAPPKYQKRKNHYKYRFKISANGKIHIKKVSGNNKHLADNKEGSYEFVDNKFILIR